MDGDFDDLGGFGARLQAAREARGLRRLDLAVRLGAGNDRDIYRWERGGRDPKLSTVLRLAAALEISPAQLVEGDG